MEEWKDEKMELRPDFRILSPCYLSAISMTTIQARFEP